MPLFYRRIIALVVALSVLVVLVLGTVVSIRRYLNYRHYSQLEFVQGELKPGQVLFTSLLEAKVTPESANEIVSAISPVLNLRSLRPREKYYLYINKETGQVDKFIYQKSPIDQYFVVRDDDNKKLAAFIPEIFLDKQLESKELIIKTSLFQAVLDQGEEEDLLFDLVDIFAWDIDFYLYPRSGDQIKFYVEKYYYDGQFVKYGRILAAQYKGRETFNAVYYEPKNNRPGYYSLQGKPREKMFLKSPLKFTGRITSYFGYRRDPFTSSHGRHSGVDFAAPYGAPIIATSDGIVYFTGWRGAYGRLVMISHSNGYVTYYGHCSRSLVRRGQKVRQGEVVAKVGSTGRSTGPHCHYEIRLRGRAFNPLKFNQPKRHPLKGEDLKRFKPYAQEIWKNL